MTIDQKRLVARIQSSQLGCLHKLKDAGLIDFQAIEQLIDEVVRDRVQLAREFYEAAKSTGIDSERLQR